LPVEEYPLAVISAAIKGNPGLWKEMERYMNENVEYDKDDDNDYCGTKWEKLKVAFGL